MVAVLVVANTITSQGSFIYPIALAMILVILIWHVRSYVRLPTAPTMYVCTIIEHNMFYTDRPGGSVGNLETF